LTVPLIVLLGFSLCFNALAQDEPWVEEAKSLPLRIITLRVAADEEFRRHDDWEKAIRTHIKAVSEVFEKNFHIRFQIEDIVTWGSDDHVADIKSLALELDAEVRGGGVELVVGLSGQHPPTTGEMKAGAAHPLGSTALVSLPENYPEFLYSVSIAHEISHIFGAWHVANQESVMHIRPTTLAFDEQTAKVINLMRGFDFRQGVTSIDGPTKKKLLTIFEKGQAAEQENPLTAAYNNLGAKLAKQGKFNEAVAPLREALRLDPENLSARQNLTGAYNNQGIRLSKQGKYNEAIAVLLKSVDVAPNNLEPRHNLTAAYINNGNALRKGGRYEGAIASYREAIRTAPNDAKGRRNLTAAYINLGLTLGKQGKYDEAITACRKAISIDPSNTIARYNLTSAYINQGNALGKEGKFREAIAAYREAIRTAPDDAKGRHS
jgi:tetratricopeptide (TPR) repeat protein